jgi:hypothetical protein
MGLRSIAWVGFIAVVGVVGSGSALAAPIEDAKAAFAAGKEAFERGDYEVALQNFTRANQLVPAPSLQYNIGNCHERLGHYKEAAAAFERYLELAGQPTTDDEKDFQDKLRNRVTANKKRADQIQAPPPMYPQQPIYQPPPPNYYQPMAPPPPTREYLLQQARARRTRAIALMATGLALQVIGMGFLFDGAIVPHTSCSGGGIFGGTETCTTSIVSGWNIAEDFFGATFIITGITLWAPGVASYVGAQKDINTYMKQEAGAPPNAFLFHSPTIRF